MFAYASNYGMVSDDEEEIPREEEDEEYRPNGAPKGMCFDNLEEYFDKSKQTGLFLKILLTRHLQIPEGH